MRRWGAWSTRCCELHVRVCVCYVLGALPRKLCADVGSDRRLSGEAARSRPRLLSFALLHCPAHRLALLLEELQAAESAAGGSTNGA